MQISVIALSTLLASFVTAQYQGVPDCAKSCLTNSIPGSCNGVAQCICNDAGFISNVSCCISTACDSAGQAQALSAAQQVCSGTGATLPSAAGCASSSGASSTANAASTSAASGTASTTSHTASTSATPGAGNKVATNGMALAGVVLGAVAML